MVTADDLRSSLVRRLRCGGGMGRDGQVGLHGDEGQLRLPLTGRDHNTRTLTVVTSRRRWASSASRSSMRITTPSSPWTKELVVVSRQELFAVDDTGVPGDAGESGRCHGSMCAALPSFRRRSTARAVDHRKVGQPEPFDGKRASWCPRAAHPTPDVC